MPLRNKTDIQVYPDDHRDHIVYDPEQREYYNWRTDMFLSEDDISILKLRPYDKITTPLPNPLPPDYFYYWDQS
jgi:hypothetical protein